MKLEFCNYVLENPQLSNFMKIRPMGAEFFHVGGQTEGHYDAKRPFTQFCEGA
jgi:hypothetical protein